MRQGQEICCTNDCGNKADKLEVPVGTTTIEFFNQHGRIIERRYLPIPSNKLPILPTKR